MESNQEINIAITLVIGILVMLILATVVVFSVIKYQKNVLKQREILRNAEKKFQNDLLDATIIASDQERESVAKNIHDDIGALTNIIKLNNNRLKNNLKNEATSLEIIANNNQLLIEINENIRTIYGNLVSPTLNKLGLIRALEQLCSQISNSIKVEIHTNNESLRFDQRTEMQLFRICKELLNNIIKHSNSSEINLNITFVNDQLIISIKYNGTGINDNDVKTIMQNNKGLGLKSIYSRVQVLEGTIEYITKKDEQASILIQIPIRKDNNA